MIGASNAESHGVVYVSIDQEHFELVAVEYRCAIQQWDLAVLRAFIAVAFNRLP